MVGLSCMTSGLGKTCFRMGKGGGAGNDESENVDVGLISSCMNDGLGAVSSDSSAEVRGRDRDTDELKLFVSSTEVGVERMSRAG